MSVDVSDDLRNAKIYLSIFCSNKSDDPNDYFKIIKENINSIKFKLGSKLQTKYIPSIKFFLSDQYKRYDDIDKLINKVK